MSVLDTCRAAVDLIMSDIPVGEPIVVDADTEEDLYSRGYLLCWDLLLTFFKAASSEAKYTSLLSTAIKYRFSESQSKSWTRYHDIIRFPFR